MLAELYQILGDERYKKLSLSALEYSINCQRDDGSWYYGEDNKYHWIDNWHTAYNLDSILGCRNVFNSEKLDLSLSKGLKFYLANFFTELGAPKYYWDREYKFDIQSASQSIDTLILFKNYYKSEDLVQLAEKMAEWTISNMQDMSGYFYLWKNKFFTNKTPTLHWGSATMYHALTNLYEALLTENEEQEGIMVNHEY